MARLHVIQSRIDNTMAAAMVAALEQRGHRVSWDVNYLIPGEPWKKSLTDAVQFCDGLVALLTPNTVNPQTGHISSQWMAADIGTARAIGKFVIPVILAIPCAYPRWLMICLPSLKGMFEKLIQWPMLFTRLLKSTWPPLQKTGASAFRRATSILGLPWQNFTRSIRMKNPFL